MTTTFYKTKAEADNDVNNLGTVTEYAISGYVYPDGTKYSTYSASISSSDSAVSGTASWSGTTSIRYSVSFTSAGTHDFYIKAYLTKDGNSRDYYAKFRVTVSGTPLQSISLTADKTEIAVGESTTIHVTFNPSNASDKSLTWTSGSPSSLSIESTTTDSATVRGVAATYNPVQITARSSGGTVSDTVSIKVYSPTIRVEFQSHNTSYGSVSPSAVTVDYGTSYTVDSSTGRFSFEDGQYVDAIPASSTADYDYVYVGWTDGTSGVSSGTITYADTFYAYFDRITRPTVNFSVNNSSLGSVSASSFTVPHGTRFSVSNNEITFASGETVRAMARGSGEFVRWELDGSTTTGGTIYGPASSSFVAIFTEVTPSYTLSLDLSNVSGKATVTYNGSVISSSTSYTLLSGTSFSFGINVTASGYSFDGWYVYYNSTSSYVPTTTFSGSISSNMTVTPKVIQGEAPIYYSISAVTSNPLLGTVSPSSMNALKDSTLSISGNTIYSSEGSITAYPVTELDYLEGWYYDDEKIVSGKAVTGPMDLIAKFKRSGTSTVRSGVPYHTGQAYTAIVTLSTEGQDPVSSTEREFAELTVDNGTDVTFETTEPEGRAFESWMTYDYTEVIGETNPFTLNIIENTILVPTLKVVEVTVTCVPNGGEIVSGINPFVVRYGQYYGTLPVAYMEGFTFLGWFTQLDGGEQVTASTRVTRTQDHYLYAHWSGTPEPEPEPDPEEGLEGDGVKGKCYIVRYDSEEDTGTALTFPNVQILEETDSAQLTEISTIVYGYDRNFVMDLGTTQKFTLTFERAQPADWDPVDDLDAETGKYDMNFDNQERWSNGHWYNMFRHFTNIWQNLTWGYIVRGDQRIKARTGGFLFHFEPCKDISTELFPIIERMGFISGSVAPTFSTTMQSMRVSVPIAVGSMRYDEQRVGGHEVTFEPGSNMESQTMTSYTSNYPTGMNFIAPYPSAKWGRQAGFKTFNSWTGDDSEVYHSGSFVPSTVDELTANWGTPVAEPRVCSASLLLVRDESFVPSSLQIDYAVMTPAEKAATHIKVWAIGAGGGSGHGNSTLIVEKRGGGGGSGGYLIQTTSINFREVDSPKAMAIIVGEGHQDEDGGDSYVAAMDYELNGGSLVVGSIVENRIAVATGGRCGGNARVGIWEGSDGFGGVGGTPNGVSGQNGANGGAGAAVDFSVWSNDIRWDNTHYYTIPPDSGHGADGVGGNTGDAGNDGYIIVAFYE